MKKTLSVNLGGLIYQIDEDGFNLLDEYLNNIRLHFRKEQGVDEIMADMESRISDLFSEKLLSPMSKRLLPVWVILIRLPVKKKKKMPSSQLLQRAAEIVNSIEILIIR
jgi:hypothetical protein